MLNLINLLREKFPQLNAVESKLITSNPTASLLLVQRPNVLGVMANIDSSLLLDIVDSKEFKAMLPHTKSIMLDLDSIQSGDLRFYIDRYVMTSNVITDVYPMDKTIEEYVDVKDVLDDSPVLGFILDESTGKVKFYKYYYNTTDRQQEYNFRFDDKFNFIDVKVYNPLPEVPSETQLEDFNIHDVDLSDYNLMHFYRENDLQSYMRIVSKPGSFKAPEPLVTE
jgi:hypothetical protein